MNQEERIALGQKIRKYRKDKGLSIEPLAEGICHPSTLSQLERGKFIPNGTILKQVCDKLGIATSDILEEHSDKLEVDALLDILKIHIQRQEFDSAFGLLEALKRREGLAVFQKQQLVLCEADFFVLTGKAELAIEFLSLLQQELLPTSNTNLKLLATIHNKLGTAFFKIPSMFDAYSNYSRAYELSLQFVEFDTLSANICYNLGNVCRMIGKDREGIVYIGRAHKFYEKVSNMKKIADSFFIMGITHTNLRNFEEASSYLQQSLQIYETLDLIQLAEEVRYAYAYLLLTTDEPDEALEKLLNSAKEQEEIGNNPSRTYTYALAAEIYLEQNDLSNAKQILDIAHCLFTDEMALYEKKYQYVYYVQSKYLLKSGELEQAIQLAYNTAQTFDKMGLERYSVDCLKVMKNAYQATGDLEQVIEVSDQIIDRLQRIIIFRP